MIYKFYTTSELRTIRDNLDLTDRELAQMMGRSRMAIAQLRIKHGIKKREGISDLELDFMRNNPSMSFPKMAEALSVSLRFVKYHFHKNNLEKTKWKRNYPQSNSASTSKSAKRYSPTTTSTSI